MHAADDDTDLPLPSLEALVAGTVALMTTWADPCPDARVDSAAQRSLLARKVVSNLFFIQNHPCASAEFKRVMTNAHQRWVGLADGSVSEPAAATGDSSKALGTALH